MDAYKLHLLLNHYPMFGTIIGIVLLVIGLWSKSDKVKRLSLWVFLVVALLTFPIYVSGEIAGSEMTGGIFGDSIKQHKDNALMAFAVIEVTGIAVLLSLILFYRKPQQVRWIIFFVLVLSLASSVIVTRTTLMGRRIKSSGTVSFIKSQTSFQS